MSINEGVDKRINEVLEKALNEITFVNHFGALVAYVKSQVRIHASIDWDEPAAPWNRTGYPNVIIKAILKLKNIGPDGINSVRFEGSNLHVELAPPVEQIHLEISYDEKTYNALFEKAGVTTC